jgi:hypothetical protein
MITTELLAVLSIAAWWWVTWPERTARRFVEFMAANRFDDATALVKERTLVFLRSEKMRPSWNQTNLDMGTRNSLELMSGQQRFSLPFERMNEGGTLSVVHTFTVRRGSILDPKSRFVVTDEYGRETGRGESH